MKIAISSTGKNITDLLDLRFGRCSYFIIYDLDKNEYISVENKGQSSPQGAGIAAAQQIIDENADVVISGALGPNAYRIINNEGIKILEAKRDSIENVIKDYKENTLKSIKQSGPAHSGIR